jgi:pre-rRNA-processing protein TSR1
MVKRIALLESMMKHFFPTLEKVNSLDSEQQCVNVLRVLCTTAPKGIHWREDRSWMKIESIDWPGPGDGEQDVVVTGVVRGKPLQSDRLVCIGDWGDFQIRKITDAPRGRPSKSAVDGKRIDLHGDGFTLEEPSDDQDDLLELAPEEIVMEDATSDLSASHSVKKGVLIDDTYHYPHDTEEEEVQKPRKLPKGTSSYQAAWYLGDYSDSGSDMEDIEEDDESMGVHEDAQGYADGYADAEMRDPTEAGPSEYPQSEAFLDPSPQDEEDDIEAYRRQRQNAAAEDLEFPDEIELNPKVLARERLARYRGLKDVKTSVWETSEDRFHEPPEWKRLLEIAHYKAARNRILKESTAKGIPPGTRVHVHLKEVPHTLRQSASHPPCSMFSLLRHEHKRTAANFAISLTSTLNPEPVKSKEELVMQCGPRRFVINPLFSDGGSTPNDVHRFRRYLHPGQTAVASVIAPLTWGSVPALFFARESVGRAAGGGGDDDAAMDTAAEGWPSHRLRLVGTGTSLPPSQSRVVAKRAVLTGHPFKIHKRLVTVRYMFFNAEDVAWFKAMRLWTRRGRTGFIKESLGTHGYFKATFDGSVNPLDAVAISLYKRVWPRQARPWRGDGEGIVTGG